MQSCFLCFEIFLLKTHKHETRRSRRSCQRYNQQPMTTSNSIVYSQVFLPTEIKLKVRGNKIVVGTVLKSKIAELEEEVRAGNSRRMRKELTGVVKGVSGRIRFLARFQNGRKKNMSSNKLTTVIVEKILVEE